MDALKHGLNVEGFRILPTEKPEEFAARLDGWNRVYTPVNQVEADLVYQAVVLSWLLDRALHYEGSFLSERVLEAIETCEREGKDLKATIRAADLATYDSSPEGEKRRRYQFALRRDLMRTLAELSRLRSRTPKPKIDGEFVANEAACEEVRQECRIHEGEEAKPDAAPRGSTDAGDAPRSPTPSAPNKADSTAPVEADFEEILRETRISNCPNKANSAQAAHAASGSGTKRPSRPRPDFRPIDTTRSSWLDISCLKS